MSSALQVHVLGGLGEIGRNCIVIEGKTSAIIIDCGMKFPSPNMLGIKKVIPYLHFFDNFSKPISGVLLTHGHEDHVGSLAYLYHDFSKRNFDGTKIDDNKIDDNNPIRANNPASNKENKLPPIYGSRLTLAIAKEKLRYRSLWRTIQFNELSPSTETPIGEFTITPFDVHHSIPQSFGYLIEHEQGNFVHTGDFKMGSTDLLKDLHTKHIDLLLSDSTNALTDGLSPLESSVTEFTEPELSEVEGKIVVTMFSTHIKRAQQFFEIAERLNRKVLVLGTSLIQMLKIAEELGIIPSYEHRISYGLGPHIEQKSLMILTTGSQGEPFSVLSRLAGSGYKDITLNNKDCVVLSSKTVPGNERNVNIILNDLAKKGVTVLDGNKGKFHVSGHGYASDLKQMIDFIKPKHLMPIHGEYKHLIAHKCIGLSSGIPASNIHLLENGKSLSISDMNIRSMGLSDTCLVDGNERYHGQDLIFDDRSHLQKHGYISLSMLLPNTAPTTDNLKISIQSFGLFKQGHAFFDLLPSYLTSVIVAWADQKRMQRIEDKHIHELSSVVEKKLEAWVFETVRKRPHISLHIHSIHST